MYINNNNNKSDYNKVKVSFLQSVISNIIITWKWDILYRDFDNVWFSNFFTQYFTDLHIYIFLHTFIPTYLYNSTIHKHSSWLSVSTLPTRSSPDPKIREQSDSHLKIMMLQWESWSGPSPTRVMLGTSFIHLGNQG